MIRFVCQRACRGEIGRTKLGGGGTKGMVSRGDEQEKPCSGMLLTFLVAHLTSD